MKRKSQIGNHKKPDAAVKRDHEKEVQARETDSILKRAARTLFSPVGENSRTLHKVEHA